MARTFIQIQAFLASPSDVAEERVIVNGIIADLNRTIAPELGMFIRLIRWEDIVPSIERRAQQVVLDDAELENSDIFIGVLWNRFGTPTGRAASGTEEEFNLAYDSWCQHDKPRIMLYFCQRPTNLIRKDELEQKLSVLNFKEAVSKKGLIREFNTPQEFENTLRQDLTRHLLNITNTINKEKEQGYRIRESFANDSNQMTTQSVSPPDGMIKIQSGEFLSGRASIKSVIDYDFYLDETPVTNSDFLSFMEETGFILNHPTRPEIVRVLDHITTAAKIKPDHPVTLVTWYDAQAYASWKGKRLASALEWERAARSVDGRQYPWGNEFDHSKCNSIESGIDETTSVYRYPKGRSRDGCFDMAGNVFEWVNDWADSPRFSKAPNSEKLNRGASYNRSAHDLICWYTESDPPDLRMTDVGFRCAWIPPNHKKA